MSTSVLNTSLQLLPTPGQSHGPNIHLRSPRSGVNTPGPAIAVRVYAGIGMAEFRPHMLALLKANDLLSKERPRCADSFLFSVIFPRKRSCRPRPSWARSRELCSCLAGVVCDGWFAHAGDGSFFPRRIAATSKPHLHVGDEVHTQARGPLIRKLVSPHLKRTTRRIAQ